MATTLREAGSTDGSLGCFAGEGGSCIITVDGNVDVEVFIGGDVVLAASDVGDAGEGFFIIMCGRDGVCAGLERVLF